MNSTYMSDENVHIDGKNWSKNCQELEIAFIY